LIADTILGRGEELALVRRFFDEQPSKPRALLLEGEAGIGKTTLWREGLGWGQARGLALTARASEAETALSFTVLGDLLSPIVDEALEELPDGQREALEVALLLRSPSGSRTNARAVGVAVLGVLRFLAAQGPLTIAIDDVQWTDLPSARTLAFGLRRLVDEPIMVVATRRIGRGLSDPIDLAAAFPHSVQRLTLGPIDTVTLGRLMRDRLGRDFGPPLVKRIHETSGGNAFFALEIGRALGKDDPNLKPGEPLPVPLDLQELLRRRLSSLSASAHRGLLLAASSALPSVALVEGAGEERSGLEEAEEAGVLLLRTGQIEFTHPLLASTVYLSASSRARREVHARLAEMAVEIEERARHLALSIDGPDEPAAEALERAALRAQERGAPFAAAELNQLAAAVTPPAATERLGTRRFRALGNLFAAGDVVAARALAEEMIATMSAGPERAHVIYSAACMSWNGVAQVTDLLTRALEEAGDDGFLRAEIQAELAWSALWACDPASSITWADSALELSKQLGKPRPLGNPLKENATFRNAQAVRAMAGCVLGLDSSDVLAQSASLEGQLDYSDLGTSRTCLGWQQMWAGALDAARETFRAELDRYLVQGHETASWEVRILLAEVEFRAARWEDAARLAREAREIAVDAGWSEALGQVLAVTSAIEAAAGETLTARDEGMEALALCERMGDRWNQIQARSALGFLELSLGDHAGAHAWLGPLVELTEDMGLREPGAFPFVPDEVEALVGLGEFDRAGLLTERLEEQGRALDRALALATAARCRGLVDAARGNRDASMRALSQAVEHHSRAAQPFELGRTFLVLGEVQRRFKQRKDARASLEAAKAIFDELGAPLWSDRTDVAIARLGRTVPRGSLTSTEGKVAELVATGKTNREIADALFLSVKTVEANVSRVLDKLGVRSRRQVAGRLTGPRGPDAESRS
jgi:DNA-binding CsgD family transcriptional regulator